MDVCTCIKLHRFISWLVWMLNIFSYQNYRNTRKVTHQWTRHTWRQKRQIPEILFRTKTRLVWTNKVFPWCRDCRGRKSWGQDLLTWPFHLGLCTVTSSLVLQLYELPLSDREVLAWDVYTDMLHARRKLTSGLASLSIRDTFSFFPSLVSTKDRMQQTGSWL